MTTVVAILQLFLNLLVFAIFARAIISWFPVDPRGPIVQALDAITEPILMPLRRVVPRVGMIDLTPMIAIFLLAFIAQVLGSGY